MLTIVMIIIVLVASWPWIRVGTTYSAVECFLSSLLNTKSTANNGEEKPVEIPTSYLFSYLIVYTGDSVLTTVF